LGQIQYEVRLSRSLSDLRRYFDRVQKLRRTYLDDFDLQVLTADVQEAIIERARSLREESNALDFDDEAAEDNPISTLPVERQPRPHGAAEIPPEVPRLDRKNWQRAIYLALLFTVLICAAFFLPDSDRAPDQFAGICSEQHQCSVPANREPTQSEHGHCSARARQTHASPLYRSGPGDCVPRRRAIPGY
jgi:hypothetical protein